MQPMVVTVVKEFLNYIELVAGVATGTSGNLPPFHDLGEEIGNKLTDYFKSLGNPLPEASASPSGSAVSIPLGSFEDTHEKRVALQEEFNKKFARDKLILEAKIRAEARKDIRTIEPQLSIAEQNRSTKRKAGQSQKLEKAKLLLAIKNITPRILVASGAKKTQLSNFKRGMQQSLANLLGRYYF